MANKTKYRPIQNSPLAKIVKERRDKALGFLVKNPGIMTRRYNQFMRTDIVKKCPYCQEETNNLIFHKFKCESLFHDY